MGWTLPGLSPLNPLRIAAAETVSTGDIWLARRASDDSAVAVKLFAAADAERAEREAALGRAVAHAHVLAVHQVVHGAEFSALVMPAMEGGSLAQLVAARGRLPWPEVLTVLTPVADALAAAHERGYVHGDLSAGNVLLDRAGRPVLADLGAARACAEAGAPVAVTPADVAPEVVRGSVPDARSDLFSLGSVALYCLTGRSAWPADDLDDVLVQSAAGQWPDIEDHMAPATLCALVRRLLSADPLQRGSAAALAVELRAVGRPEPVTLLPSGGQPPLAPATVVRPDALRPPGALAPEPRRRFRFASRPAGRAGSRTTAEKRAGSARARAMRMAVALLVGAAAVTGAVAVGWWWAGAGRSMPTVADIGSVAARVGAQQAAGADQQMTEATELLSAGDRFGDRSPSGEPPVGTADPPAGEIELPAGAADPLPHATETGAGSPFSDPEWSAVVAGLDLARSEAITARDPALLSAVYTADAGQRRDDENRIAALLAAGYHPSAAVHQLRSVVLTAIDGDRLVLDVVAALPATAIRNDDGALVGYTTAAPATRFRLVLVRQQDGFRIAEIAGGSADEAGELPAPRRPGAG